MESIRKVKSQALSLHFDHLDNNDLIPKFLAKNSLKKGSGAGLLNNYRYLPGLPRRQNPDHPLNREENKGKKILIPGAYFATEIDYEQAVWAVLDAGFRVVISNEIGHTFKKHAHRNGLLCVGVSLEELRKLKKLPVSEIIEVDLESQTISAAGGSRDFEIDINEKEYLMNGLEDTEQTLDFDEQIEAYENRWNSFYEPARQEEVNG